MHYKIFSKKTENNCLSIEFSFKNTPDSPVLLQLPAWRPGRYELQNFAKNISRFEVFDENQQKLAFKKQTKDSWLVLKSDANKIIVSFDFYACKRDAGNSFVDDNLLYINPVNLCLYVVGQEQATRTLEVVHDFKDVVCGLPRDENGFYVANSFYELADSPLMASDQLLKQSFTIQQTVFNVWFEGKFKLQWERILRDFERFTAKQIEVFGEFPESEYHFITWVLPEAFYHGVEHRNSTMMVLGPDSQDFEEFYIDLLGLASHELFHAWNICKIRPAELLPYDYTKENYFETCYVSEGITTYYGDLMLHRSGVFTDELYRHELETCYRRHFEGAAGAWQSLAESSYDLWLDGYAAGVPKRKVSVYHKGAIAAQILDLTIQKLFDKKRSLDDVLLLLWQRHGKTQTGFSAADYRAISEEVAGCDLSWYFDEVINSNVPLEGHLNNALAFINLQVSWVDGHVVLKKTP